MEGEGRRVGGGGRGNVRKRLTHGSCPAPPRTREIEWEAQLGEMRARMAEDFQAQLEIWSSAPRTLNVGPEILSAKSDLTRKSIWWACIVYATPRLAAFGYGATPNPIV